MFNIGFLTHHWSTLKKLVWLNYVAAGGSSGTITTVTGVSPLALVNAAASNIRSLIQTGKCVHSGTPTPSAPVDIVCNNGALRMVHRSGLPSGYKLLEYVGSSGSAYVVTDVYLASTDVVEAEFRNNSTTGYGSLYGVFKLGDSSALYANQTYYGYDESNNKVDTDLRVNTDWHSSRHDFVNGTLTIDDTTVTFPPFEFANSVQNAVLARYYNNSYGYIWKGFIRKFKVTRGGEVICDLLPAKNESDEAGLYDLISGTFYTATSGTLVAGDEVDDYELRVVGTPEVLTVGKNLFSQDSYLDAYCSAGGTITAHNSSRCFVLECKPNTEYRFIFDNSAISSPRCVINGFVAQPEIGMRSAQVCYSSSNTAAQLHDTTFTTDADVHYLVMWLMYQKTDADTKEAVNNAVLMETATSQTATVANLFAVGDYADTQDIINGAITRRVGVKVLDGTEGWVTTSVTSVSRAPDIVSDASISNSSICASTHFVGATHGTTSANMPDNGIRAGYGSAAQKGDLYIKSASYPTGETLAALLAAQYAAGTPVIVLYQLAEETTESVTPQPLRTAKGNNTVSVTSEVDPVELSVAYTSAS